jgi:hypothetical protein
MFKLKLYNIILGLIPVMFFVGILGYASFHDHHVPKYNLVYYISNRGEYKPNAPECKEYISSVEGKLIINENSNGRPFCDEIFYVHSVKTNTYRVVNKAELMAFEYYNLDLNKYSDIKDPDGFKVNQYGNGIGWSPFFSSGYSRDGLDSNVLSKSFSKYLLKTSQADYINYIGFLKNNNE